jgi:hypothetical protein
MFCMLFGSNSPWMLVLDPGPGHVRFVADKAALGQVSVRLLRPFSVSVIPLILRNRLHMLSE